MGQSTALLSIHDDSAHMTSAKRGGVSGVASLDVNSLLNPAHIYPLVNEYSNHLGAVDNYTQALVATGTATTDAAAHKMDLVSANASNTYASFSEKRSRAPSAKPLVVTIQVQGIVNGSGTNLTFRL